MWVAKNAGGSVPAEVNRSAMHAFGFVAKPLRSDGLRQKVQFNPPGASDASKIPLYTATIWFAL